MMRKGMESRRTFIKNGLLVCIGAGGAILTQGAMGFAAPTGKNRWGMIIDLKRCTGCQSCVIACKLQNHAAKDRFLTSILEKETGAYPTAKIAFTPVQCNQCQDPPCVPVCPTQATYKLANGIVVTDWNKCIADGRCVEACPYDARFLDERFGGRVDKCDFCLSRLRQGLEPACVESCAPKARIWGDFKNPSGEFAQYLKLSGLSFRRPELGITTNILYRGKQKESANEG